MLTADQYPVSSEVTEHPLAAWHRLVRSRDSSGLEALLAENAVFHLPIVHAPQRGRAIVALYLGAAFQVLSNPQFRYVREIVGPADALLEFETVIDERMAAMLQSLAGRK